MDISYENASFGILEDSTWLQFIYFLTTIASYSNALCCIHRTLFIAQISHYGKFTALPKLISIVLQLTNQTKSKFPAKPCGARAIFLKLLRGRGCKLFSFGFSVSATKFCFGNTIQYDFIAVYLLQNVSFSKKEYDDNFSRGIKTP